MAAAAARKRPPAPPAPPRDNSSAIPLADRIAIQFDLAWAGEYNGLINGEFNDKTIAAIKAYQRNRKFKETGVLNTQERALLAASAKAKQAQVGWSMVDDTVTGARLGVPTKQVPNKTPGKNGTRWASAQGQMQVETFRIREPGTTLASVYEQQKKEPSTRKLEFNFLKPDFFVLDGHAGPEEVLRARRVQGRRGARHDVALRPGDRNHHGSGRSRDVQRLHPVPRRTGAVAQIGPPPKRKVEYGTGIVVSAAGHILTDRQVTDGCNVIVVSGYGDADRQAEDKRSDLALLRVYGVPDLVPAAFTGDSAKSPDLTLLGIADPQAQGGGSAISTLSAKLRGDAVEPSPQLGFSGARRARRPGPLRRHGRAQDPGRRHGRHRHRAAAGDRRACADDPRLSRRREAVTGQRARRPRGRHGVGRAGDLRAEVTAAGNQSRKQHTAKFMQPA